MYKTTGRIRYSECGPDNKLTLSGLINYFQDSSCEHSDSLGVGGEYLKQLNRAWILNTWQVEVNRLPGYGEAVEVVTWPTGFKGILGPRDFYMQTVDGEMLARATTLWVCVDTETGRPVKPQENIVAAYTVCESQEMEAVPRKIALPEESVYVDTFPVHKYHIDTNNHVNNSQYIRIATEILPEDFQVKKLRVEYKKAAVLGDVLVVKKSQEEDRVVAVLCGENDTPYVVVEFRGDF